MDSPSTSASSYELRSRVLRSLSIDSHIGLFVMTNWLLTRARIKERLFVSINRKGSYSNLRSPLVLCHLVHLHVMVRIVPYRLLRPAQDLAPAAVHLTSWGGSWFGGFKHTSLHVTPGPSMGLSIEESKRLRSKYTPAFEGNFVLLCPK
jgi:hypothetical protein